MSDLEPCPVGQECNKTPSCGCYACHVRAPIETLCSDCPPVGYSTEETRCTPCPRRNTRPTPAPVGEQAVGENSIGLRQHLLWLCREEIGGEVEDEEEDHGSFADRVLAVIAQHPDKQLAAARAEIERLTAQIADMKAGQSYAFSFQEKEMEARDTLIDQLAGALREHMAADDCEGKADYRWFRNTAHAQAKKALAAHAKWKEG